MPDINQSVGLNGSNQQDDVKVIQQLLNKKRQILMLTSPLPEDGQLDVSNPNDPTIAAIRDFQRRVVIPTLDSSFDLTNFPYGLVEPGTNTITKLNEKDNNGLKKSQKNNGGLLGFLEVFKPIETLIKATPVIFAIVLIAVLGFDIIPNNGTILKDLSEPAIARGLITLLVAITTVWIAMILAISAISEDSDDDKFNRGKDILTILVGILGTIIGYYFGTESQQLRNPESPPAEVQVVIPSKKLGINKARSR